MSGVLKPTADHPFWRYLAYLKPYRWRLAAATLMGVAKYNLPVLFPWILKDLIDNLLAGRPSRWGWTLDTLMILALGIFVLYAVITYLRTILADRLEQDMMHDVRNDLFRHLQELPIGFFQQRQTGVVTSRLFDDVNAAQRFVGVAGTNVFMDLTCLATITLVIFALNWKLALVACCTLPLFLILQRYVARQMKRNVLETRRRMDLLVGSAHEHIGGISEVKSYTREEETARQFVTQGRYALEAAYQNVRTYGLSLSSAALLTRIPPVLVLWAGGHFVLGGELTLGSLMAFYAYLEMIYNPLNRLTELNVQLASARAAIDRIFQFLDCPPQSRNETAPALRVCAGAIAYDQVTFGYVPGLLVLQSIAAKISPAEHVALVGASGSGKSTFCKLLVRFHDPWEGRILIDGQDIRQVQLHSLRAQIALVQQDPILFAGTLEENIRFGRSGATSREICAAAEQANLGLLLRELPRGLHTEVGERGTQLSGGQRQRVALARAFLKDAPILVLDESTSSVDGQAETLIYDAMARLMSRRTTLIIAHRLSTVARAHRVLVLEAGRIVQDGTHAQLLREQDGPYGRLVRSLHAEKLDSRP